MNCYYITGLFQIPDVTSHTSKNTIPLIIICDNIREPGNLGTILRTCAGVGCAKVILTKGLSCIIILLITNCCFCFK